MNAVETRQYEMLQRVREFGNTHRHLFPDPGIALETFATLAVAIAELAAADIAKRSASASARSDRKAEARKALSELVLKVSQTARVIRARGYAMPPFDFPDGSSDQALLTTARQFARDAVPHETEFVKHGMVTTTLPEAASALEAAMRDRGIGRSGHLLAGTRIRELMASAFEHLRTLDVLVKNELAGNKVLQTVWKRARHVDYPRRPRGAADVPETPMVAMERVPPLPGIGQ
jgi:hypothetical protein